MLRLIGKFLLFVASVIFIVACAIVVILAMQTTAKAHSWYSSYCCSGQDCAPIPKSSVKTGKYGYEIRLTPKDHPSLSTPFSYTVPYGKAQLSEDEDYHACILRSDPDVIRCLYTPNMGF